jgi:hypothetical protein
MRVVILLAVSALLAAPAAAIDLTGTWEGSFKCAEFDGSKFKFKDTDEILEITQSGTVLNVLWTTTSPDPTPIQGIAIDDDKKPDQKGSAAMIDCDTTTDLTSGYGEIANLQASVNRTKGKGKLKGKSIYTVGGDVVGECKWSFKLMDLADPGATGCP